MRKRGGGKRKLQRRQERRGRDWRLQPGWLHLAVMTLMQMSWTQLATRRKLSTFKTVPRRKLEVKSSFRICQKGLPFTSLKEKLTSSSKAQMEKLIDHSMTSKRGIWGRQLIHLQSGVPLSRRLSAHHQSRVPLSKPHRQAVVQQRRGWGRR